MTSGPHPPSQSGSADLPGGSSEAMPPPYRHDEQEQQAASSVESSRQPQRADEEPSVGALERAEPPRWRGRWLDSVPARAGIALALLLWVLAVYWAVVPLEVPTSQGPPFRCGTALSRPADAFGRNVCGQLNDRTALKAGAFGVAGVIVLLAGFFVAAPIDRDNRPGKRAGART